MQDFRMRSKLLRKELQNQNNIQISKAQWRQTSIEILASHKYFTDYCQKHLTEQKQKNLLKLKQHHTHETDPLALLVEQQWLTEESLREGKSKPKSQRPDKGIETLFRITSTKSQALSDQADNKAHILITVNSIIISVLLSTIGRTSTDQANLTLPSILMTTVCLVVIAFAILSTTPNVPKGTFTQEEIDEKKVNLLFFGNFYRMHLDEYSKGMLKVMDDRDFLYLTLIRDVYGQGIVLGRKYRLLKLAYYTFLIGLIISVISYFIASRLIR